MTALADALDKWGVVLFLIGATAVVWVILHYVNACIPSWWPQ